jgi:hypothetical protein
VVALVCVVGSTAGCGTPGAVRFDRETCTIDGARADLTRVEERESAVQHRIARRQPWLVAMTIVVVCLAGISYVERLILLFSASRGAQTMGDRVRALVDRYRAHRAGYLAMVVGSIGLLVAAGTFYIYLDADKRASERALAALQFCHLALRTADEKSALDEQRRNLSSIHDTASEIRQLIAKLPPDEQAKAHQIIGHMDDAVGRQGRLIAEHLERSEETAAAIRDRTQSIEKGVSGLQSDLDGLKPLPVTVRALGEAVARLDGRGAAAEKWQVAQDEKLTALARGVETLSSRAPVVCPACVCGERGRTVSAGADAGIAPLQATTTAAAATP